MYSDPVGNDASRLNPPLPQILSVYFSTIYIKIQRLFPASGAQEYKLRTLAGRSDKRNCYLHLPTGWEPLLLLVVYGSLSRSLFLQAFGWN